MDPDLVLNQLSSRQDRRDQGPNRMLAEQIIATQNTEALDILAGVLQESRDIKLRRDILLCFAWVSENRPAMMVQYAHDLLACLPSGDNRMKFAAMIGLSGMAPLITDILYDHLPAILSAMESGSIVAKDHGVNILLVLYSANKYRSDAFPLFLEQLVIAPDNQLGQYAEKFLNIAQEEDLQRVRDVLVMRSKELSKASHQRRISKTLKQLNKKNKS